MKKEEIYVLIKNEQCRDRAVEILTKAGDKMGNDYWMEINTTKVYLIFDKEDNEWIITSSNEDLTQITLNELENMLLPKKVLTKEDLPIGTKVVPHDKTAGQELEYCYHWGHRKKPYLYVVGYSTNHLILNRSKTVGLNKHLGAYYNYSDVTLYKEKPEIKKSELLERLEKLEKTVEELTSPITLCPQPSTTNKLVDEEVLLGDRKFLLEEMQKLTSSASTDLNAIIGKDTSIVKREFLPNELTFEVGKVYKSVTIMFYTTKVEDGRPYGFGFGRNGKWEVEGYSCWFPKDAFEVSEQEWLSRLTKEATSLGYEHAFKDFIRFELGNGGAKLIAIFGEEDDPCELPVMSNGRWLFKDVLKCRNEK